MKMLLKNKRGFTHTLKLVSGFTLIELLVVVAIISLLSSIVFASLDTARKDAKDKAIIEAANQLNILMGLNYDEYGDYCKIQPTLGNITSIDSCNSSLSFTGTYGEKAKEICSNMYNNAYTGSTLRMRIALSAPTYVCTSSFSWAIRLNDGSHWYCVGSSGRGEYAGSAVPAGSLGCNNNP